MLGGLEEFVLKVLAVIVSVLPNSPIGPYIDQIANVPWIGKITYFVPLGTIIAMTTAWGVGVGIYYTVMLILRWAKAVSD